MLNQLSGDPNCELFPQGPIIPVPPCTPPYRPVRTCGNNWAVSQVSMQKESSRTRGFESNYSHYFAGGFVLRLCPNSTNAPPRHAAGRIAMGAYLGLRDGWFREDEAILDSIEALQGQAGGNMCRPARATTAIQPCPPFPATIEVDERHGGSHIMRRDTWRGAQWPNCGSHI